MAMFSMWCCESDGSLNEPSEVLVQRAGQQWAECGRERARVALRQPAGFTLLACGCRGCWLP